MDIETVLTIIYYVLEILIILYAAAICIKNYVETHMPEPSISIETQETEETQETVTEDNILLYLFS